MGDDQAAEHLRQPAGRGPLSHGAHCDRPGVETGCLQRPWASRSTRRDSADGRGPISSELGHPNGRSFTDRFESMPRRRDRERKAIACRRPRATGSHGQHPLPQRLVISEDAKPAADTQLAARNGASVPDTAGLESRRPVAMGGGKPQAAPGVSRPPGPRLNVGTSPVLQPTWMDSMLISHTGTWPAGSEVAD